MRFNNKMIIFSEKKIGYNLNISYIVLTVIIKKSWKIYNE